MKKLKKAFLYCIGAALSFFYSNKEGYSVAEPLYGVPNDRLAVDSISIVNNESVWEKALNVVLSPIFLISTAIAAVVIGSAMYVKRKQKLKTKSEKNS